MKMKQKQDRPTRPCYATPRVYLDAKLYFMGHAAGTKSSEILAPTM